MENALKNSNIKTMRFLKFCPKTFSKKQHKQKTWEYLLVFVICFGWFMRSLYSQILKCQSAQSSVHHSTSELDSSPTDFLIRVGFRYFCFKWQSIKYIKETQTVFSFPDVLSSRCLILLPLKHWKLSYPSLNQLSSAGILKIF